MSLLQSLTELESGITILAERGAAALFVAKEALEKCALMEQELQGLRQMLVGDENEQAQKLAATAQQLYSAIQANLKWRQHCGELQKEIKMLRKVAPHATSKVPSVAQAKIN